MAPDPLLDHVGKGELAREEDCGEVHRHQSIPVFDGRVDDVGLDPNARVIDEDVNPAGFPHDPFHQLPDRIGIGDVADGFDDLARRFVEREVHAVDPVSEVQELPGDRRADAASRSGDDDRSHHCSPHFHQSVNEIARLVRKLPSTLSTRPSIHVRPSLRQYIVLGSHRALIGK